MKRALITGITGQDGSYLTELLLGKGYEVHGIIRRASNFNTQRIEHLYEDSHEKGVRLFLHFGDMADGNGLHKIVNEVEPHEVYNLAAQSHVAVSFKQPEYTANIVATGTLRLLEAVWQFEKARKQAVRFYQAGTSEMFGNGTTVQNESTRFNPCSPYAISKVAAHHYCVNYREAHGMFVCNGILFNHESPRRGETFLTRKITRAMTRIRVGIQDEIYLGDLTTERDWGHAKDYVLAMWLMLQQDCPNDYVIATGEAHTGQEFLEFVCDILELNWRKYFRFDERYCRPRDVYSLCGDAEKARRCLNWKPEIPYGNMVAEMVAQDMKLALEEKLTIENFGDETK